MIPQVLLQEKVSLAVAAAVVGAILWAEANYVSAASFEKYQRSSELRMLQQETRALERVIFPLKLKEKENKLTPTEKLILENNLEQLKDIKTEIQNLKRKK